MSASPPVHRLVLAGAGHAHAQVLKAWPDRAPPGVELVVVSPHAMAPYSGMVPGWLAGSYGFQDIVIDFPALCARAGARWVPAAIDRLDPDRQCLELDSGETLHYDFLSLNTGSTLVPPACDPSVTVLSMRPLSQLKTGYDQLLERWQANAGADAEPRPFRVLAVGGGAAGVESVLAVVNRLRTLRPDRPVQAELQTRGPTVLPGYPSGARRLALRALQQADIAVRTGTRWTTGSAPACDLLLWAAGAQAHAWQRTPQRRGRLAVSPEGFVQIDGCLRSVSHPRVFAVGDCAHWQQPLPKAGVYAVRMGPVLLDNLLASLQGTALRAYAPQTRFLSLLATADGRAIATRGRFSLSGRWAWRWKDRIDRAFVNRFAAPPALQPVAHQGETP